MKSYIWIILAWVNLTLACSLGNTFLSQNANAPVVAISRPVEGQQLQAGQATTVESVSIDAKGVTRVELMVNGQVIWADVNAQPAPETPFIVAQPWTPVTPGHYTIQVNSYNAANKTGQSEPVTVEVVTSLSAATTSTPPRSPTPAPTQTPTRAATPPPSATLTPKETSTPVSPTATPTVTQTPTVTPQPQSFKPTGVEPEGRFREIWLELGAGNSRLGYPVGPEITGQNYAKQVFERGLMFWWDSPDDPNMIWVLDSPAPGFGQGATSNQYFDTWDGGDEFSCAEARNGGPVRGFGKLWCERPELRSRLGFPSEPEFGSGGQAPYARVQFFQGGVIIHNPLNNAVYVLFEQGDWQQFDD